MRRSPPVASPTACSNHGASKAVRVDVGYGQRPEPLRTDERVGLKKRTNLPPLPLRPALWSWRSLGRILAVADLSFISWPWYYLA